MKASLLISTMCILYTVAFTQDLPNFISNTKVTTVTYWEVGDKVSYHCVKDKSMFKNGKDKPKSQSITECDIKFHILEQTDSSYLIELTYSNFSGEKDATNKLADIADRMKIRYVTDELGSYDSIVNGEELILIVNELFTDAIEDLDDKDSIVGQGVVAFREAFIDADFVEAMFVEDIYAMHGIYGFELVLNEVVEYDMIYATLADVYVGGEGTLTLKSVDKIHDRCRVYEVQKPNSDEIANYLEELVLAIAPEEQFTLDDSNIKFKSSTKVNYTMELSTGWMLKLKSKTTVIVNIKKDQLKNEVTTTYVRI